MSRLFAYFVLAALCSSCGQSACDLDNLFCQSAETWKDVASKSSNDDLLNYHNISIAKLHPPTSVFADELSHRGEGGLKSAVNYADRVDMSIKEEFFVTLLFVMQQKNLQICKRKDSLNKKLELSRSSWKSICV